ncbi:MAG: hypothetical protein HC921_11495 [Synechococcaceae cyanobacterium SM2_3_1]|nr:hypothetical protein [Synechococcaceae cyanobacterium SM2_3_1]
MKRGIIGLGATFAGLVLGSCSSQPPNAISMNQSESATELLKIDLGIGDDCEIVFDENIQNPDPVNEDLDNVLENGLDLGDVVFPPECFIPKFIQSIDILVEPASSDPLGISDNYTVRVNGEVTCPNQVSTPQVIRRGQTIEITLSSQPSAELVACPDIFPPATSRYEVKIPLGELSAGVYQLQVNEEAGVFQANPFTDWPGSTIEFQQGLTELLPSGLAQISEIELINSNSATGQQHLQVVSDLNCGTQLMDPQIRQRGRQIMVTLATAVDPSEISLCDTGVTPVATEIPLGALSRGLYRVRVNTLARTFWVR